MFSKFKKKLNKIEIYMKDPESAEIKEKSNLRFFRYLFLSYGHFCDVITSIFDEFSAITRKIETGEFFLLLFPFYSAHSASLIKFPPLLKGGGSVYP